MQRKSLLQRLVPPLLWPPLILLAIYGLTQHYLPEGLWPGIQEMAVSRSGDNSSSGNVQSGTIPDSPAGKQLSGRVKILDGDTIELNGQRIRLKGIDTPETRQSCHRDGKPYRCGITAREQLASLIGRQPVTCQNEGRDQYNRILGLCRTGNTDLNRTLVEQGWAVSYGLYQREEAQARNTKRGLWAGTFERPSKWRKSNQYRSNRNGRDTTPPF